MKVPKSVRDLHMSLDGLAQKLETEVKETLEDFCKNKNWIFHHRRKGLISFAQKLEKGVYYSLDEIDDFFGCEIVVPNLSELEPATKFVKENFQIESEKPDETTRSQDFSFDGIRIYAKTKISPRMRPKVYSWMTFEIPIKTLLEKAWGEATHDFTYKCKDIQWSKERLVYQMRAILSNADIILADLEYISDRPFLSKPYPKYEKLNLINAWIIDTWDDTEYPENMRRLSQTVQFLCKDYKIDLDDLKKRITQYFTQTGKPKNLSIYATILKVLIDTKHENFLKKIQNKPHKKQLKLLIPDELEIDSELKQKLNRECCIILSERISAFSLNN